MLQMRRWIIACAVIALMAQGVYGESEDHARLIGAVSGFKQAVIDSIDLNANQAADSYALLATAAELTPWWRELARLALDTINAVVGLVCDLDGFLTSEGGTRAMEDPLTFKQILKEIWMSKDPLAYFSSEIALLGLVMSPESYKISFQSISDVEQLARDVYSVDNDFLSASNAARIELWRPSKQNGLLIPLRNGPRLKEGGRNTATQWENGIEPVRQEIVNSIDRFILGIPDPLPAGYPLEENIAYLNDLTSQIRKNGFHIVKFKSIEMDKLKERHVSMGMVKEDREAASFLYDSWLNNLDIQYTSTIVDTGETILDITSYGAKGTVKTASKGLSDLYDVKGIIQAPEEFENLIDKTMNPLDALQNNAIKTNIDLIQETSNLWTLSTLTLDYLVESVDKSHINAADDAIPTILSFNVTPLSLTSGEPFAITYNASSNGGPGLKQVELWRKDESSDWQQINTNTLAGEIGPTPGSFTDTPSAPGRYWYGVHVVDNAGNWNDERNSNTKGQPSSFEPAEVEVKSPQEVTLTLYVRDGSADGPVLSGAEVTGQDAAGKSFSQTTDANGFVVITGSPGIWRFTATKPGYAINSWSQEITETCTKHAYIFAEKPTVEQEMQPPAEEWNRTFGGPNDDWANFVQPTDDGGYILAGASDAHDSVSANVWICKTDAEGNEVWSKTFSGAEHNIYGLSCSVQAYSIHPTSEGGYLILAGWPDSAIPGGVFPDAWLIKLDSNGNDVWNKTLGENGYHDLAKSIQLTSEGGYILAGETVGNAWLIKTDSEGNEIWSKTLGIGDDVINSVRLTLDGGYILAGETRSMGAGRVDAWLIKTDSNGNELWNRTFGGELEDEANSVLPTYDSGYILAGETRSFGNGHGNAWLIKTDSEGNEIWNRTLIGEGCSGVNFIQSMPDGSYTLGGWTKASEYRGSDNAWLIKVDSEGNEIWSKILAGERDNSINSIQSTPDGGYVIAGITESFDSGGKDAWLIKVAPG